MDSLPHDKVGIKEVEDLAAAQGITSLKFYNRKREHMIPTPNDLLEGVGGDNNKILSIC